MSSAGDLRERILCQSRADVDDELGNPVPGGSGWATQFSVRAGFKPKHGGEVVLAGRLAGRQTYIVTVRSSMNTRQIAPDWRLVDARNPKRIFNVRSLADPDGKRQWLEILAEEGVAT